MRAVREGDYYILDGQKMFDRFIKPQAKYSIPILMLLMAKTDPSALPGEGLSLFLLENTVPGITCNVLSSTAGWNRNQAFFDKMKLPKNNRRSSYAKT